MGRLFCWVWPWSLLAWGKKQPELHEVNQFVTVTAGHSNKDPGAVNGKFKEAELVSQFRNAVAYYLREAGIQYKTDGVGTLNQDLNAAIKLIKGSSVAVEFHMNAAASKQANGIETIALPKDKKLAQDLSKAVQMFLAVDCVVIMVGLTRASQHVENLDLSVMVV